MQLGSISLAAMLAASFVMRTATVAAAIPLPEHPRPDRERSAWINLNGEWDFTFDHEGRNFDRHIVVPFGWGSPLYSQLYDAGVINQSFYVETYDFPHGGVCYAGGRCPDPMRVLGSITDAASAFCMDKAAAERLERLKRARLGGFLMSLDAPEDLASIPLAWNLASREHRPKPSPAQE